MKDLLSRSHELQKYGEDVGKWADECCGTVHKFQGKEAKEVIFLLGCDKTENGAVQWVNTNIINVAATRAKFRFYVIGDYEVWSKSQIFKITKGIIG